MDRFVAFIWDPNNTQASSKVARWSAQLPHHPLGWSIVLDQPGIRVAALNKSSAGPVVTHIARTNGVVVGALYARGSEQAGRILELTGPAAARFEQTRGASLITDCWGSYVAIWRDAASGVASALSDPCGATACFTVNCGDAQILCSYVSDIASLSDVTLSIDWREVLAFLAHNYFITPHTGLAELVEVLPGQRMGWTRNGARSTDWAWNPIAFAADPIRRSFAEHRDELRATADACFDALGRTFSSIIVRLSGGLDSSVVANLIRRKSGGRITGVHLVGRGYEAYELELARLAARHAGIDLLELEMDQSTADIPSLEAGPLLARPSRQILGASADAVLQQACEAVRADVVMGGHGGDNLFLQRSIASDAFADFIRLNGMGRGFWETAYDTAMLLERSVWGVLQGAGAYLLGLRKWRSHAFLQDDGAVQERQLLTVSLNELAPSHTQNPWLLDAEKLPPCKAEQVRGIVALRNYHPLIGHGLVYDAVHPFISQPLIELALRTPAYVFNQGGIDRSLERAAFADILPPEITRRTLKGFVNHQLTHDLADEVEQMREFILDGHIVANGIVDRARTESLLSSESLIHGNGLGALMGLMAAEAWIRPWQRRSNPAA